MLNDSILKLYIYMQPSAISEYISLLCMCIQSVAQSRLHLHDIVIIVSKSLIELFPL